jgi:hypothetical protein
MKKNASGNSLCGFPNQFWQSPAFSFPHYSPRSSKENSSSTTATPSLPSHGSTVRKTAATPAKEAGNACNNAQLARNHTHNNAAAHLSALIARGELGDELGDGRLVEGALVRRHDLLLVRDLQARAN